MNPNNPPEKAPSGKPASAYGEFLVRVWFTGPKDDPFAGAECAIKAPPGIPFPYWMIAAEHMATAMAQKSGAGFERALELLVEGATTNRGRHLKKPDA